MKNSTLEKDLNVARKSSDDTMEKLKDVEGKCNHLQQNLDKYVVVVLIKLQDTGKICGVYVFGIPLKIIDCLWFVEFRLQEKLTNLENENHVLRQKAFNMPPMNNLAATPKTLSEVIFFVTLWQFNAVVLDF